MRKYFAEFIGTAVLVFFGCGSAVAASALFSAMGLLPAAFTTLQTAVAFGLALMAACYMIGDISGCHVNPAVSLAMLITKRMGVKDFVGYVIAQCLGGIAAAGLMYAILGGNASLGANVYGSSSTFGIEAWLAFLIEVVLTFTFVLTVLTVTAKAENKAVSGLVIGLTLTLVHIFGVPFTGTSVNPARSLGPALLQGGDALTQLWVFIAAPLAGAVVAALAYMVLWAEPKAKAKPEEAAADAETSETGEIAAEEAAAEETTEAAEQAEATETGEIAAEEATAEETTETAEQAEATETGEIAAEEAAEQIETSAPEKKEE